MSGFWMIRAGEGGYLIDEFDNAGYVGIGWEGAGDFTEVQTIDEMREIIRTMPDVKPGARANSASMAYKFRRSIEPGDRVISYDPRKREYLFGTFTGDYEYDIGVLSDFLHVRRVQWDERISRDALSPSSRNTLGSTSPVFEPGIEVLQEIETVVRTGKPFMQPSEEEEEAEEEFQVIRQDVLDRAHEFIKDRIRTLSPEDMEALTAAILRAMGYKARVTPKGPDRGRDVIASPDGLGFQTPRVVAEVKHRPRDSMGADKIRSFIGGLRTGDQGLYVSTGGFTKEANYEAERSSVPVTLVDLDNLALLVVEHYDQFDPDGRSLIPLTRVYWPAS